jgi:hypothetical protein
VTIPSETPDEPGNRRQADGPQVLPEQAKDKDMREPQDPYDPPFPDDSDRRPSRVRDRRRPAPRLAAKRPATVGRVSGNGTHPRTRARPGSQTITPTRKALPWA